MAWPTTEVAVGEMITAAQLNGLPVRIANTTLSGNAASIEFSSVPGHYAHLLLTMYLRGSEGATNQFTRLRFNGDGGGNYDDQWLVGVAAGVFASESLGASYIAIGENPAASGDANLFGVHRAAILNYAQASNNKAVVGRNGSKYGVTTQDMSARVVGGFWRSNAAVVTVTISPPIANLVAGSRATLYGLP